MTPRYYPLEALVSASGLSEAALARSIGLSGTTLKNARTNGLREDAADRYAVRAGFTPWEVWGDFAQQPCAECDELFLQRHARHRYCSKRCRERRRMRLAYQNDPEVREARRSASARYYEEAGDYVRSRMRRRHHANRDAELARMRERYQAQKNATCAPGSPQDSRDGVAA